MADGRHDTPRADRGYGDGADSNALLRLVSPGFVAVRPESSRAHEGRIAALTGTGQMMEGFHCDLASGIFTVGPNTARRHEIEQTTCGAFDLLRHYDRQHLNPILHLYETASSSASSFCYSTTILTRRVRQSRMVCIGVSLPTADGTSGIMRGVFAFLPTDHQSL